jgi:hypothetical protein
VVCDRFAWRSLGLAKEFCVDQRENRAKPNTHHEVVAVRVGRFSSLRLVDALEAVDELLGQGFAGFGPEEAAGCGAVLLDREGEG